MERSKQGGWEREEQRGWEREEPRGWGREEPRGRERVAVPRPARAGGRTAGQGAQGKDATPAPGPLARLTALRLTALGSGLATLAAMALLGGAVRLLLDASPGAYGVCFVIVGLASALWVRPADQFTAPVVAPIAYAVGLVLLTGGSGGSGLGERAMTVVTALAVEAGWVYGGTAATALVAVVRRAVLAARRRRARQERPTRRADTAGPGRGDGTGERGTLRQGDRAARGRTPGPRTPGARSRTSRSQRSADRA